MAEKNIKINVKTSTGYDTLYPQTKAELATFDKTSTNLTSTNVEAAIKEVNTKATNALSTASTANSTANNALSTASIAYSTANNALSTASTANSTANNALSTANTANSTANTNKTNIGTLSNLKTAIKTSIVNAINSLYNAIIGKTLKTLDEVDAATQNGYYVDALVNKELSNRIKNMFSVELKHINAGGMSYYILSDKQGYNLLNAYTIRSDTSFPVKSIQRRGTGGYTIMFEGNVQSLDLYLIWGNIFG